MNAEPVKRILIATDFSSGADRAATVGIRLAQALGGAIDLVHIYVLLDTGAVSPIPGVVPIPSPDQEALDEVRRRLEEMAGRVRSAGLECHTFTTIGNIADEIIAQANHIAAELIVLGTHGRTGIRRVLLGSVAEDVLRKAHRPVLIVPPPPQEVAG